jgi:hypothetical protein
MLGLSWEKDFRKLYPDCKVQEEQLSENFTRYRVMVCGEICSESGDRELAFRWALEDLRDGKLQIPETNQLHLRFSNA